MVEKRLNSIDEDFAVLEQCNKILFTHWRDGNAEAFNNSIVQGLRNQHNSFSTEARLISKELRRRKNELEDCIDELERIARDISDSCANPSIAGCHILQVVGNNSNSGVQAKSFVVLTRDEACRINDTEYLRFVARQRCKGISEIEKVTLASNL